MTVRKNRLRKLLFAFSVLFFAQSANAQYCAPSVTAGNVYINHIGFNDYSGVTGGVTYNTNYGGYTQTVSSSSGTVKRYGSFGFGYNIHNNTATTKTFYWRVYADWNNDGDFNDAYELAASNTDQVTANATYGTGSQISPPIFTPTGNIRIRVAVSESTSISACGSFTGEVEDYIISIAGNTAPVLNTSAIPFINGLDVTQTNSDGITINELIYSSKPAATLITDADNVLPGITYPQGIAVTGVTASNGTWQYNINNAGWTNFGAVSSSNALLLLGNGSVSFFDNDVRIRFVPTGAGTASITYKAWDGTSGTLGGYGNTTTSGGATPYSTASGTASITVSSPAAGTSNIYFIGTDSTIYKGAIKPTDGTITQHSKLLTANDAYGGIDLELDAANSKLYWIDQNWLTIHSATVAGASPATLVTSTSGISGLAVGPDRLYYLEWNAYPNTPSLNRVNKDGTGKTEIIDGPTLNAGDIGDIEYSNGKLYFAYYSNTDGAYEIVQVDTTGLNPSVIYSTANYIRGLSIASGVAYWTETDNGNNAMLKNQAIPSGPVNTMGTFANSDILGVLADAANQFVYAAVSPNNSGISNILRFPTTGTTFTNVATLPTAVYALTFDVTNSSPLPVTLTSYKVYAVNNASVNIDWQTAVEQNNDHYEIYRSIDGKNFDLLTSVARKNAANSDLQATYRYTDYQPKAGNNYYRLRQVDLDGTVHDYGVKQAYIHERPAIVRLYPNPVNGNTFMLDLGTAIINPIDYYITDMSGKNIASGTIHQQKETISLGNINPGGYILKLENGTVLMIHKK